LPSLPQPNSNEPQKTWSFENPDNDKFIVGYLMAEELIDDLNKGVRVLASESDFFLSRVSLKYFLNFFEYSARENLIPVASRELGIEEDIFALNAITGVKMLKKLSSSSEDTH
ncbi:MAG: hypothetical protein WCI37_03640, partial [bacterium]